MRADAPSQRDHGGAVMNDVTHQPSIDAKVHLERCECDCSPVAFADCALPLRKLRLCIGADHISCSSMRAHASMRREIGLDPLAPVRVEPRG